MTRKSKLFKTIFCMAYVFHRLAACFSFLSHPFKLYRGLTRNMEPGNLLGHPASSIPELRDKIMEQRLELSRKDQRILDLESQEEDLQRILQEATRRVADAEQLSRDKLAQVESVIARLL